MNPKGARKYVGKTSETVPTISLVLEMLDDLHGGQWPRRTEGDNKSELGFELCIGGNAYEMKLLDSAGEDLQRIGLEYEKTNLTPFRQELYKYIISSNVVVLIVNLDHFADAPSLKARGENENVLKEIVDNLVQAGMCHYILVCFTAYDKYEAHIRQTYGGDFIRYLRDELPMFYRSCDVASKKVIRDYADYGFAPKMIRLECIAVAPVIAQKPSDGVNPDRIGKPPIGFDVRKTQHSMGMEQMADWLYSCEQSERGWSNVDGIIERRQELFKFLMYRLFPISIGAFVVVIMSLFLANFATTITTDTLFNTFFFGAPLGAAIGFLIGDKIKVLAMQKDGIIFKKTHSDEEQEESETSGTAETPGASSHKSGTGKSSRKTGAGGSSHSSGTGGGAATSGSEEL